MPAPTTRRRRPLRRAGRLTAAPLALGLLVVALVGCDASSGGDVVDPGSSSAAPTAPSGTSGTSGSATPTSPTTPGGSGAATTPATSGPATPPPTPGTFAIAVAGGGQVSYPVGDVRCDAATVVGTLTPADGQAPGTVTLVAATGVLTVAGVAPIDGTRLTGTTTGTPGPGVAVQWTGDGTGSAASLAVTCP